MTLNKQQIRGKVFSYLFNLFKQLQIIIILILNNHSEIQRLMFYFASLHYCHNHHRKIELLVFCFYSLKYPLFPSIIFSLDPKYLILWQFFWLFYAACHFSILLRTFFHSEDTKLQTHFSYFGKSTLHTCFHSDRIGFLSHAFRYISKTLHNVSHPPTDIFPNHEFYLFRTSHDNSFHHSIGFSPPHFSSPFCKFLQNKFHLAIFIFQAHHADCFSISLSIYFHLDKYIFHCHLLDYFSIPLYKLPLEGQQIGRNHKNYYLSNTLHTLIHFSKLAFLSRFSYPLSIVPQKYEHRRKLMQIFILRQDPKILIDHRQISQATFIFPLLPPFKIIQTNLTFSSHSIISNAMFREIDSGCFQIYSSYERYRQILLRVLSLQLSPLIIHLSPSIILSLIKIKL